MQSIASKSLRGIIFGWIKGESLATRILECAVKDEFRRDARGCYFRACSRAAGIHELNAVAWRCLDSGPIEKVQEAVRIPVANRDGVPPSDRKDELPQLSHAAPVFEKRLVFIDLVNKVVS